MVKIDEMLQKMQRTNLVSVWVNMVHSWGRVVLRSRMRNCELGSYFSHLFQGLNILWNISCAEYCLNSDIYPSAFWCVFSDLHRHLDILWNNLRYGFHVLKELQSQSPEPSHDHLKFKRWLIKIYRESDAPLKTEIWLADASLVATVAMHVQWNYMKFRSVALTLHVVCSASIWVVLNKGQKTDGQIYVNSWKPICFILFSLFTFFDVVQLCSDMFNTFARFWGQSGHAQAPTGTCKLAGKIGVILATHKAFWKVYSTRWFVGQIFRGEPGGTILYNQTCAFKWVQSNQGGTRVKKIWAASWKPSKQAEQHGN